MTGARINLRQPTRLSIGTGPYVLPETAALALVCVLDTVSTVWLVANGLAVEANPILAWSFNYGMIGFVPAKTFTFLPALFILERLRGRYEKVVRRGLRLGIATYVVGYAILSIVANAHLLGLK